MYGNHRSRFVMLSATLAAAAVGTAGCNPDEPLQKDGETVAELALGGGVKMDIVAVADGSFIYSQSGPLGSRPHQIPEAIKQQDPVELFRHFAPTREVPRPLLMASARARAMLGAAPANDKGAAAESPLRMGGEPPVKPAAPGGQEGFQYLDDNTESNWTGVDGCPTEFFSRNWCGSNNFQTCVFNYEWAFLQHDRAYSGWGAVCANDGQLTFRITREGSSWEYQVDQGSWRTAEYQKRGPCGLFTCEWERGFTRFELVDRPNDWNSGHFASSLGY